MTLQVFLEGGGLKIDLQRHFMYLVHWGTTNLTLFFENKEPRYVVQSTITLYNVHITQ
jgi:hypothetical protein